MKKLLTSRSPQNHLLFSLEKSNFLIYLYIFLLAYWVLLHIKFESCTNKHKNGSLFLFFFVDFHILDCHFEILDSVVLQPWLYKKNYVYTLLFTLYFIVYFILYSKKLSRLLENFIWTGNIDLFEFDSTFLFLKKKNKTVYRLGASGLK